MSKVRKSLAGSVFIESKPKNTARVGGSIQNMLQLAVMLRRNVIEVKDVNV